MATRLPTALSRRPTIPTTTASPFTASPFTASQPTTTPLSHTPLSRTPSRAATLIKRPRRPYTFTQLVQLSDGSTYTMRTASPQALYKSTKDTRNHILWNPNDKSLQNVEVDEAGKLAAFRERFGRGWDAAATAPTTASADGVDVDGGSGIGVAGKESRSASGSASDGASETETEDPFADLIAGYAASRPDQQPQTSSKPPAEKKKK